MSRFHLTLFDLSCVCSFLLNSSDSETELVRVTTRMALEQLPGELLLTIGDHLPNQPLRPCSRGLQNVFQLPADPKWRQYDPQRVRAL